MKNKHRSESPFPFFPLALLILLVVGAMALVLWITSPADAASWPNAVSSDATLYKAVNNRSTYLSGNIDASTPTVAVITTAGFPAVGFVTIDGEAILYQSTTSTSFTSCTRGSDGTNAATHQTGTPVYFDVVAAHHNVLKDELIAMSTYFLQGSAVHIDTANARVGIGTAAPTVALDVIGQVRAATFTATTGFSGNGSGLTNLSPAAITSGSLGSSVLTSSVAVGSISNPQVAAGTFPNITLPAANVAAGSLGANVIASSQAAGSIYNAQVNASAGLNLSKLSLADNVTWTGAHTFNPGASSTLFGGTNATQVIVQPTGPSAQSGILAVRPFGSASSYMQLQDKDGNSWFLFYSNGTVTEHYAYTQIVRFRLGALQRASWGRIASSFEPVFRFGDDNDPTDGSPTMHVVMTRAAGPAFGVDAPAGTRVFTVFKSSITATVLLAPQSATSASIQASTPTIINGLIVNSDIGELCLSTGITTAGSFKRVNGGATCW